MSIEFAVGKRVVTLENFPPLELATRAPCAGEVFTIREITLGCCAGANEVYFCFEEFSNPEMECIDCGTVHEIAFISKLFRPCRDTDISVLESLLVPMRDELVPA